MTAHVWTTAQREQIEVKWMTTPHLVHSFNMVLRKQGWAERKVRLRIAQNLDDVFQAMYQELNIRHRFKPSGILGDMVLQLAADNLRRESPQEMCMLRAILDTYPEADIRVWKFGTTEERDALLGDPKHHAIHVKFIQYRLEHA